MTRYSAPLAGCSFKISWWISPRRTSFSRPKSRFLAKNKVLAILENDPGEGGGFLVPYSREEMAAYLGAGRSALSRLLSQMAKKKLISYEKTFFWLLTKEKN
jgi:hypothetical protein